jgi:hypothetical protein
MCVLLCANSNVREWFDIPTARAYRETLQLQAACASGAFCKVSSRDHSGQLSTIDNIELDEAAQRRIAKRSAWLQAYCCYRMHLAQRSKHLAERGASSISSSEWHKAFETLAKSWGRLLSLVGLRW